jgi:cytochrome c oxidase subunit 4
METATEHDELAAHPGPKQYVLVALVLAIATAMEVGWYYLDVPHGLFVALLMFLAVLKFSLVALWFMHLRFDNRIFKRLFVTGLLLAIAVYLIVLTTFGALKWPLLVGFAAFLVVLLPIFLIVRGRGRQAGPG